MEIEITNKSGRELVKISRAVIDSDIPLVSNLANLSRVIYEGIEGVSWAGFYLTDETKKALYLGPYQGPLACTTISFERGVCGFCARNKETVIVDNVHEFEGHIACSSSTNSELVVPILKNNEVLGVIDLDSNDFSNFGKDDAKIVEEIAKLIAELF